MNEWIKSEFSGEGGEADATGILPKYAVKGNKGVNFSKKLFLNFVIRMNIFFCFTRY